MAEAGRRLQTILDGARVDGAVFTLRSEYRAMLLAVRLPEHTTTPTTAATPPDDGQGA